jgi:two-component system LytT family response regulator
MIRVAVVDNNPLARSGVLKRLRAEIDVNVLAEYVAGHRGAGLRCRDVDIAIVDMQRPRLSGLDGLSTKPADERPMAILLSAHDSFAVCAFELEVVNYRLKPIDNERFSKAIDHVRRSLGSETKEWLIKWFTLRIGSRMCFVAVDGIVWVVDGLALRTGLWLHLMARRSTTAHRTA